VEWVEGWVERAGDRTAGAIKRRGKGKRKQYVKLTVVQPAKHVPRIFTLNL
jgi:hypothetical protein